jgi:hypothetical protein
MTVLEEGLVSYLQGYAGLTALISTRMYLARIPETATLPCLTYQRISTPRELAHDTSGASGSLAHPRFQFDAWASTFSAAKAITEQVRAALNGKTGSTGGVTIRAALVADERMDYDPESNLYRSQSDFIIWHEE